MSSNVAGDSSKASHNLVWVNPETSESMVPRKRLSDVILGPTKSQGEKSLTESTSKKIKVEMTIPKPPLSQVTNTPRSKQRVSRTRSFNEAKHEYNMTIGRKPSLNMKDEIGMKQDGGPKFSTIITSSSEPQVDHKPQSFPLMMDVDHQPHIKREDPSASTPILQNSSTKAASVALSSFPAFPLRDIEPTVQYDEAIASGLKPSIPKSYEHGLMDVGSDDVGYDSDFYGYQGMPAIANEIIDKIGIKVPPPIVGDALDYEGDYYGRGHDIFVGPQAQPDECVASYTLTY